MIGLFGSQGPSIPFRLFIRNSNKMIQKYRLTSVIYRDISAEHDHIEYTTELFKWESSSTIYATRRYNQDTKITSRMIKISSDDSFLSMSVNEATMAVLIPTCLFYKRYIGDQK